MRGLGTQVLSWTLNLLVPICTASPRPLGNHVSVSNTKPGRKLTGKFLHITDVHPDPYYKTHSSTEEGLACHRGNGAAGVYGAETSACDSPVSLLDATFKWINETIRDDIDFIVWTGDSARHDNDERIPRSEQQVVEQNELLVDKFLEVFGKPDNYDDDDPTNDFVIPIIPTFGNNDVLPHNIFTQGPNRWTRRFLTIWRHFIPEEQRHQFQRGGWFYVEVIPNQLAVFSLNTLYFFDSNAAVDGCSAKSEPGYEQLEWLRIQLQLLRERGMKAILTGHVPPARVDSKVSWDESCWQKYTLWMRQYRDVILTSIYGHMNMDHFMLQDFKNIKKHVRNGVDITSMSDKGTDGEDLTVASAGDYLVDLRDTFAKIPTISNNIAQEEEEMELPDSSWSHFFQLLLIGGKKPSHKPKPHRGQQGSFSKIGGQYGERYSLSFVGASVVPNYLPTLRVFQYNITGLKASTTQESIRFPFQEGEPKMPGNVSRSPLLSDDVSYADFPEYLNELEGVLKWKKKRREQTRKRPKRRKFNVPKPPSKSSPPGPAYSPQTLSLLGYTQYYANLTHINNDFLEKSAYNKDVESQRWKPGHHHGKVKHGKPHPNNFTYLVEYDTSSDKVFGLKDLTVRSYIKLARRIAESKGGGKSVATDDEQGGYQHLCDNEAEEDRKYGDPDLESDKHKKKKKHKNKKKKHKKKGHNKVWFTFVKRAFVGTMDPSEIDDQFGTRSVVQPSIESETSLEL